MKKTFTRCIYICFSASLLTTTLYAATDRDIYPGFKGSDVIAVQTILHDLGIYNGPITGGYYTLTKKAVLQFQKENGIRQTGNVGKLTRAKLISLYVANQQAVPISEAIVPTGVSLSDITTIVTSSASPKEVTNVPQSSASVNPTVQSEASQNPSSNAPSSVGVPSTTTAPQVDSTDAIPVFNQSLEDRS